MKLNIILFVCLFFTFGCSAQTKDSGTYPTVINKFLELNVMLEHTQFDLRLTSDCTVAAFARDIKKEGNHKEGVEAMAKLQNVMAEYITLVRSLDDIKDKIRKDVMGGPDIRTGILINAAEETKLEILMIGVNKEGLGWKMEKALKNFTEKVARIADINERALPQLAEGNRKNPLYRNDVILSKKDFVHANFGQTPAAAALAIITHKQNEVLRTESIVIRKIIDDMRNSQTKK